MSGKPYEIIVGDVRRVLRDMPDASFDAVFADPPYGINFMGGSAGCRWDYDVPSVNVFVEVLRVLKPGAHAFFFGGTRTFHRMAVNIEDAGFLPVDLCMWLYGSGFSKTIDIGKHIDWRVGAGEHVVGKRVFGRARRGGGKKREEPVTDDAKRWTGYGNLLKPAWEPLGLFCKMHEGTIAENCVRYGTGGLDIDGTRVGSVEPFNAPAGNDGTTSASVAPKNVTGYKGKTVKGRMPANLVLSHSSECRKIGTREVRTSMATNGSSKPGQLFAYGNERDSKPRGHAKNGKETIAWECVAGCPVRMLDQQSGHTQSPKKSYVAHRKTFKTGIDIASRNPTTLIQGHADEGGASRFFYNSKVSRTERDRGLGDEFALEGVIDRLDSLRKGTKAKNAHPTLKPIDLCRYFARMLLPPPRADGKPRRLLVPYSGAGSEMIGALQAGWDEVVGIELVPKHAAWAMARIAKGQIIRHSR